MSSANFMENYKRAVKEVEDLGEIFEKEMKKSYEHFSKEYFCWMFESLLQYSLLELSWVDGRIDPNEIFMSRKIFKYADIVDLGNTFTRGNLKWEFFVGADPDSVKEWLEKMKIYLDPIQRTFVLQFASFDNAAAGDSLSLVTEGLISILSTFCNIDGDDQKVERDAVLKCKIIQTTDMIKHLMKRM